MTALGLDYNTEVDSLLSESIESVLDRERNTFDRLIEPFENRIVLFGAGNLGRRCLACLRRAGLEPQALSDNNQRLWNTELDGLRVLPPTAAAEQLGPSTAFVVTIWHREYSFHSTLHQLRALGCRQVIPFSSLRWKFAADLLPDYCLDAPHKLALEASQIRSTADLWADDESRQCFLGQLRWRLLGDHLALHRPSSFESYFPDDIFALAANESFVDCGAYDGDTIRSLLRRRGDSFQRVYSFEPDRLNYARLKAYVRGIDPAVARKISLFDLAVGSQTCAVHFSANGDEGSSVSEASPETVSCVPLDDVLADAEPTYIKMDIEGFEAEGLAGARRCIDRCNPVLAICAYHRQADLWRVPQLIHSTWPAYRLFLRDHEPECWQLVCYAVPPERLRGAATGS